MHALCQGEMYRSCAISGLSFPEAYNPNTQGMLIPYLQDKGNVIIGRDSDGFI